MTDCETLQERLVDLAEDTLDGDERSALGAHLTTCPDCRQALEETRLILRSYADRPELDVAPGAAAVVWEAARREARADPVRDGPTVDGTAAAGGPARSPGPRHVLRRAMAAAAALLVGWLLWLAVSEPATPEPGPLERGARLVTAGDVTGAEQVYRRALERGVGDPAAVTHRLGRLLLDMQRHAEASAMLSQVVDRHPDYRGRDAACLDLGEALVALGELDRALAAYQQLAVESRTARSTAEERIRMVESLQSEALDGAGLEQLRALGYTR